MTSAIGSGDQQEASMRQSILLIAAIAAAEFPATLTLADPRTPAQQTVSTRTCTDVQGTCYDAASRQARSCTTTTCTYTGGHTTTTTVLRRGPTTTVRGSGTNPPSNIGTNKGPTGTRPIVGVSSPAGAGVHEGLSGGGTHIQEKGSGGRH
jgi:hypothetical protein